MWERVYDWQCKLFNCKLRSSCRLKRICIHIHIIRIRNAYSHNKSTWSYDIQLLDAYFLMGFSFFFLSSKRVFWNEFASFHLKDFKRNFHLQSAQYLCVCLLFSLIIRMAYRITFRLKRSRRLYLSLNQMWKHGVAATAAAAVIVIAVKWRSSISDAYVR